MHCITRTVTKRRGLVVFQRPEGVPIFVNGPCGLLQRATWESVSTLRVVVAAVPGAGGHKEPRSAGLDAEGAAPRAFPAGPRCPPAPLDLTLRVS